MPDTDKITHLQEINKKLDICFDYDEDDRNHTHPLLGAAGLAGAGAGGVLGHQAISRTGGYAANVGAMRYGPDLLGKATGNVAANAGKIGGALNPAYKSGKDLLKSILAKLKPAAAALSSKGKEIRFADNDYKPRIGQRLFLGPGLTIGIHGKKGERVKGAIQSSGREAWETVKGGGAGAGVGAAIGAGIGALSSIKHPERIKNTAAVGGAWGGLAGGQLGLIAGKVRGGFGKKAENIYRQRTGQQMSSRQEKLIELSSKIDGLVL